MMRLKEILFSMLLGLMTFFIIQTSLIFAEKPNKKQRIPIVSSTKIHLSFQAFYLIKELVSTEFFQIKNDAFIQSIRSIAKQKNSKNHLNGLTLDLKKAISIILVNDSSFNELLIHFYVKNKPVSAKIEKHYIQFGRDVFYFPNSEVNPAYMPWLKKNVFWRNQAIKNRQFIIRQTLNGNIQESELNWEGQEIRLNFTEQMIDRSLILSPRFFHYSNLFPKNIWTSIPKDQKMRSLLKNLHRISVNYENGKLSEDEQFPFSPSFEALLEYEQSTDLENALNTFKSNFSSLKWTDNQVIMGSQTYYFKKTSPKTLYVCTNKQEYCPSGTPIITRCQTGFLCMGDLARLTTIKNTGWAGLVLDMIPAFRSTKELFDASTPIRSDDSGVQLTFKNGHLAIHELLNAWIIYNQD